MSYIDKGKRAKDWLAEEPLSEEYQRGFNKGFEEGYKQGVKNGRRRTKGKPEFPKATGRPKVLGHGILILEFMDYVDRLKEEKGVSVVSAVSQYLAMMSPVWRQLRSTVWSRTQLVSLYERAKKGKGISADDRAAYETLNHG